MVKWYRIYRVTRNHVITLTDESAFTLYRGEVATWCRGRAVSWRRGSVASNYHGSSAPETIRAWGELEASMLAARAGKLRAASWSRNQKFNIILTKRAGKIFCHN